MSRRDGSIPDSDRDATAVAADSELFGANRGRSRAASPVRGGLDPLAGTPLELVATGASCADGPVWLPSRRVVLWSDVPADRVLEFSATTGMTRVYRRGSALAGGRNLDERGDIVQCSRGRRAIERDTVGVVETIVDAWGSYRLNSPGDVVVAADGGIWFTDPLLDPPAHPPLDAALSPDRSDSGSSVAGEYGGSHVFRFDESTRRLTAEITGVERPGGLAFSPDERTLYVVAAGKRPGQAAGSTRQILAFRATGAGLVAGGVFAELDGGCEDGLAGIGGIRVDEVGRVWASGENGVSVYSADGILLRRIEVPEPVGNICFGGDDGRDLYIAATTSLYRIRTTVRDAAAARRIDRELGLRRSRLLEVRGQ